MQSNDVQPLVTQGPPTGVVALRSEYCDFEHYHATTLRLARSSTWDEAQRVILDGLLPALHITRGLFSLVTDAVDGLVPGITRGLENTFLQNIRFIPIGLGSCGRCLKTRQRIIVENVAEDPFMSDLREPCLADGILATHSLPLTEQDGTMLGVLTVLFDQPRKPTPRDGRLMDLYSQLAADFVAREKARATAITLRHYAAIVQNSEDAIIGRNLEGIVTSWNKGAERLYGYSIEEMLGNPISILIPAELNAEEPEILERLARSERIEPFETLRRRKDGRVIDISLTLSPVKDDHGTMVGVSKIARDITSKKRQEALSQGQRQVMQMLAADAPLDQVLRELVITAEQGLGRKEEMRGAIFHVDNDRHCLRQCLAPHLHESYVSAMEGFAIANHHRCSAASAAFCGNPVWATHLTSETPWQQDQALALAHGFKASWSVPFISSNCEVLGTFTMHPAEDREPDEEEIKILSMTARTASIAVERRHAAVGLREKQERLDAALNAASMGTFVWDMKTNRMELDDNLCRLFAVSPAQRPRTLEQFSPIAHVEDRAELRRLFEACAARGDDFEGEFRVALEHDQLRWLYSKGKTLRDENGTPVWLTGACVDVTQRKVVEQERERARDEALAVSRAKDDFLAALSHELRTPLNPVLLIASEAAENPDFSAEVREDFETIRKNVELEARLIDDLLDLTRITRGKLALNRQSCSIRTILQDAMMTVQEDVRRKEISLTCRFGLMDHRLVADAARLQQALWNVLKNAVKFTPALGRISVETLAPESGHGIIIRVTDTGIGITPSELECIFDGFSQGDHAGGGGSHRFGGLGLGLAISRKLVEMHSGSIRAHSAGRGHGATFEIELPLSQRIAPTEIRRPLSRRTGSVTLLKKGARRILLVEDHEPTRTTLARLLTRRNFDVVTAGSLAEARAVPDLETVDLLISDIGLPDGTGYDLMVELKREFGMKGIALSGYGMDEDIAMSERAGFLQHLVKPLQVQLLESALSSALPGMPVIPDREEVRIITF